MEPLLSAHTQLGSSAMKLVEVVRTIEVSDEVYQTLFDFARRLGKVPVKCKDTPGWVGQSSSSDTYGSLLIWERLARFIVNRLYVSFNSRSTTTGSDSWPVTIYQTHPLHACCFLNAWAWGCNGAYTPFSLFIPCSQQLFDRESVGYCFRSWCFPGRRYRHCYATGGRIS